jgi:hypothetical protein
MDRSRAGFRRQRRRRRRKPRRSRSKVGRIGPRHAAIVPRDGSSRRRPDPGCPRGAARRAGVRRSSRGTGVWPEASARGSLPGPIVQGSGERDGPRDFSGTRGRRGLAEGFSSRASRHRELASGFFPEGLGGEIGAPAILPRGRAPGAWLGRSSRGVDVQELASDFCPRPRPPGEPRDFFPRGRARRSWPPAIRNVARASWGWPRAIQGLARARRACLRRAGAWLRGLERGSGDRERGSAIASRPRHAGILPAARKSCLPRIRIVAAAIASVAPAMRPAGKTCESSLRRSGSWRRRRGPGGSGRARGSGERTSAPAMCIVAAASKSVLAATGPVLRRADAWHERPDCHSGERERKGLERRKGCGSRERGLADRSRGW